MTIVQVYKKFPTEKDCLKYIESVRWKDKPVCPYCKVSKFSSLKNEFRYHCNSCNTSFSVTVGTIFHRTHIDLQKWFLAISLVLSSKNGISARQLSQDIKVNKNTAWFMIVRIRRAMIAHRTLLEGVVEMTETHIGGERDKFNRCGCGGTFKRPVVKKTIGGVV